jgi:phosphoglycolate phosphatase-like HAD superfamily hydrolase
VLQELKKRRMILAVASNIPTLFLREHLRKFKIDGYFDTVTGQEDCDEQKPSPKPILVTIEKLGAKPQESMYVGDMEEDIIAGKRANAMTVAIVRNESYHPRWRLERQKPDFLISSLRELLLVCSG